MLLIHSASLRMLLHWNLVYRFVVKSYSSSSLFSGIDLLFFTRIDRRIMPRFRCSCFVLDAFKFTFHLSDIRSLKVLYPHNCLLTLFVLSQSNTHNHLIACYFCLDLLCKTLNTRGKLGWLIGCLDRKHVNCVSMGWFINCVIGWFNHP
jgi:hypothetical protein